MRSPRKPYEPPQARPTPSGTVLAMRLSTVLADIERRGLALALHGGDVALLESAERLTTLPLTERVIALLAADDH